jgi:hypothetical protein
MDNLNNLVRFIFTSHTLLFVLELEGDGRIVLIIAQTFRKLATFSLAIPTKISQPKM